MPAKEPRCAQLSISAPGHVANCHTHWGKGKLSQQGLRGWLVLGDFDPTHLATGSLSCDSSHQLPLLTIWSTPLFSSLKGQHYLVEAKRQGKQGAKLAGF